MPAIPVTPPKAVLVVCQGDCTQDTEVGKSFIPNKSSKLGAKFFVKERLPREIVNPLLSIA
jgi:hypothetical protein